MGILTPPQFPGTKKSEPLKYGIGMIGTRDVLNDGSGTPSPFIPGSSVKAGRCGGGPC